MGSLSNTSTAAMPGRPRLSAPPARRPISSAREVLTSSAVGFMRPGPPADDGRACVDQAQVQRQHVAARRRTRPAKSRRLVAVGAGACGASLAAPDLHLHAEGAAVAGHELADAP
jgi:hypothetical protein